MKNLPILETINLHKHFGKLKVLKGIDFSVNEGEIVSIIGPSGSGKSTLLRCFNHLETIDEGILRFEGQDLAIAGTAAKDRAKIPHEKVRRACLKLGMVFQNFHLFPHLTVLENVMEAPIQVARLKKEEAKVLAMDLLNKVGLADKADSYPSRISGGQKQRAAIARALGMRPKIMLFDEPTSALDPELVGEVLSVIKKLAEEKMTLLIVTHEMSFARELSDRIVFMDDGRILESASPEKLLGDPDHPRIKSFIDKIL